MSELKNNRLFDNSAFIKFRKVNHEINFLVNEEVNKVEASNLTRGKFYIDYWSSITHIFMIGIILYISPTIFYIITISITDTIMTALL